MKKVVQIVLIILAIFPVIVNAEIKITDDLLEAEIKKLIDELSKSTNEYENVTLSGDITLDKTNKKITMTSDGETQSTYYKINDDNTITFMSAAKFYKGMTYEQFESASDELITGAIGYILIAHMNNIKVEDSIFYYLLSILHMGLSNSGNGELTPGYVIIPDDATFTTDDDTLVIKESEFGQYALELAKKQYGDATSGKIYTDNDEGMINSFTFKYSNDISKITGLTQSSDEYYVISEMTINPNADFKKIDGFSDKLNESINNGENESNNSNNNEENVENTNLGSEESNPKTGITNNYLILGLSLILGVFALAFISQKDILKKI